MTTNECDCHHCDAPGDPALDGLCAFCFGHCIDIFAGATGQQLLLVWVHNHNAHHPMRERQRRLLSELAELDEAFKSSLIE